MKILALLVSGYADAYYLAKRRLACIRSGHSLLCTVDGHLCTRCGRHFCHY